MDFFSHLSFITLPFVPTGHVALQRDQLPPIDQPNGPTTSSAGGNSGEVRTNPNSAQSSPSLQRVSPHTTNTPLTNGLPNGSPVGVGSPSQSTRHNHGHQRNTSNTSSSSASTNNSTVNNNNNGAGNLDSFYGFIVAVHRKMVRTSLCKIIEFMKLI